MLVLSRKKNEEVLIGDNVRVQILDISGTRVSLGIVAPSDIPVVRTEVVGRIQRTAAGDAEDQEN